MAIEDEIEMKMLFKGSPYASKTNTSRRVGAERRAAMTDKQRTRKASGGGQRTLQINFRGSPAFKELATGLTGHMTAKTGKNVSLADVIEQAIYALAKAEGYRVMGEE